MCISASGYDENKHADVTVISTTVNDGVVKAGASKLQSDDSEQAGHLIGGKVVKDTSKTVLVNNVYVTESTPPKKALAIVHSHPDTTGEIAQVLEMMRLLIKVSLIIFTIKVRL